MEQSLMCSSLGGAEMVPYLCTVLRAPFCLSFSGFWKVN